MTGRVPVAAFDFDGTLTREDTMVPFLPYVKGWPRVVLTAVLSTPSALRNTPRSQAAGWGDWVRDGLKVATVGRLFKGMTLAEMDKLGRDYAEKIRDLLRPEMLDRVEWHRDQGHATVIVSASLAVYLRPIATELDIDHVLGVELVADGEGVLTGRVDGGVNTRGPHKVRRLQGWIDARFGPGTELELWAYGDSPGDRELLALANHPTWIN